MNHVICGISGGVDSAVSAYLLKSRGFRVTGLFIKNWDTHDELGHCSGEKDLANCQKITKHLGIDLIEHNNVKNYWNKVFTHTLKAYQLGYTPNPDILCNRFVKFNLLNDYVKNNKEFTAFATGHYAQNSHGNFLENKMTDRPKLLRSVDRVKDQSFWLSTIKDEYLRNAMFPVGQMLKKDVKQLARDIGLEETANQKESMGMCFIGKRDFPTFIDEYLEELPGEIIFEENGECFGHHKGVHHYTYGQRLPISNRQGPFYVSRFNISDRTVFIVRHTNNPKLFMKTCRTYPSIWLTDMAPKLPKTLHFQWQNKWKPINAVVSVDTDCEKVEVPFDYSDDKRQFGPPLKIELEEPMRCIAPGQWAALYEGNVCLGAAQIRDSTSIVDEGWDPQRLVQWDPKAFELFYDK